MGRVTGIPAVGAWAARLEIANLLEKRCDPDTLIDMIRRGEEGEHSLRVDGSGPEGESWSSVPKPPTEVDKSPGTPMSQSIVDEEEVKDLFPNTSMAEVLEEQQAILSAIKSKTSEESAPWLKSKGGEKSSSSASGLQMKPQSVSFSRPATPPPLGMRIDPPKRKASGMTPDPRMEEPEHLQFKRKAEPPPLGVTSEVSRTPNWGLGGGSKKANSLEERERENLEIYLKEALEIFEDLEAIGIQMDLQKYVRKPGEGINKKSFLFHTSPNRASTGLRYIRVMKGLTGWVEQFDPLDPADEAHPFERLKVVEYVEHLVQKGVGAHTPQTLLFALDFFGKAFGFEASGTIWNRAKRLAVRYAKAKPGLAKRAPVFSKQTLVVLESIVQDPFVPKPGRIAAGKLRLCCQASVRYDDLLHTAAKDLEWVRRRGSTKIVAVRAKTTQGKTRARPWIASFKGVTKDGDGWVESLMKLIVEAHGSTFLMDDHFGKEVARDPDQLTVNPARMEADVAAVKRVLISRKNSGEDVGMTETEIGLLRWHGCKATMTTLMQHLQMDPRTVRFAGDWSAKEDAMPDVYLREALLMVLKGQEACLSYLREGGDMGGLVSGGLVGSGSPPGDVPGPGSTEAGVPSADAMAAERARVEAAKASVGAFEGVEASNLGREFLDPCFACTDGSVHQAAVDEELKQDPLDQARVEALLESSLEEDEVFVTYVFDGKQPVVKTEKEDDGGGPVAEIPVMAGPDRQLADEDGDVEGLASHVVMLNKPRPNSRMHLPSEEYKDGTVQVAVPKCGVSGAYGYISAGEAIDPATDPCSRCFGKRTEGSCRKLCGMKFNLAGVTYMCKRRCVTNCADSGAHLCHVHGY